MTIAQMLVGRWSIVWPKLGAASRFPGNSGGGKESIIKQVWSYTVVHHYCRISPRVMGHAKHRSCEVAV